MSRVYETRFLGQNKLYECKSRLNENAWEIKAKMESLWMLIWM